MGHIRHSDKGWNWAVNNPTVTLLSFFLRKRGHKVSAKGNFVFVNLSDIGEVFSVQNKYATYDPGIEYKDAHTHLQPQGTQGRPRQFDTTVLTMLLPSEDVYCWLVSQPYDLCPRVARVPWPPDKPRARDRWIRAVVFELPDLVTEVEGMISEKIEAWHKVKGPFAGPSNDQGS